MTATIIAASVALLLSLGLWGVAERAELARHLVSAAWLGLLVTIVGVYFGVIPGAPAALVAAVFGALAAQSPLIEDPRVRAPSLRVGASVATALALGALVWAANFGEPGASDENMVLLAGQWAALGAAMGGAFAAIGASLLRGQGEVRPLGAAAAIASLGAGVGLLGWLRADAPGLFHAVPLRTVAGDVVRWELPAQFGGARSLALDVAIDVPLVLWCAVGAAGIAAVACVVRVRHVWLGAAAAAIAGILGMVNAATSAVIPDVALYLVHARALGGARRIPDEIVAQGSIVRPERVVVMWADLVPGLVALLTIALVAFSIWYCARPNLPGAASTGPAQRVEPSGYEGIGELYARDLLTRSSALVWLAWMLGGLLSWKLFSAYGRASALEWQFLGAAVWGTGLVFLTRVRSARVRTLLPGLFMLGLVLVLMTSAAYGLVPGVSVRW